MKQQKFDQRKIIKLKTINPEKIKNRVTYQSPLSFPTSGYKQILSLKLKNRRYRSWGFIGDQKIERFLFVTLPWPSLFLLSPFSLFLFILFLSFFFMGGGGWGSGGGVTQRRAKSLRSYTRIGIKCLLSYLLLAFCAFFKTG